MKSRDIQIGGTYLAKVSGRLVPVRVTAKREQFTRQSPNGRDYWLAVNTWTGREIRILSAQRFREQVETEAK